MNRRSKHFEWASTLSEVERVRERYRNAAYSASLKTGQTLEPIIGVPFQVTSRARRAESAYDEQWCPNPRHPDMWFAWHDIWRLHHEMEAFHMVIWSQEHRLSGLCLCVAKRRAVEIKFLEGDYRADCPLRGKRVLIALEAAANYAQALGREELRIQPVNDRVRSLYQDTYGFEPVSQRGQEPYFRRAV